MLFELFKLLDFFLDFTKKNAMGKYKKLQRHLHHKKMLTFFSTQYKDEWKEQKF